MKLEVTVPGTLSNLGPGFDVLGMAVQIENAFRFETLDQSGRFVSEGQQVAPGDHVTFDTMVKAASRFAAPLECGVALEQLEQIPRSRGLGSSAAARAAGLVAWSRITEQRPPIDELLSFLAEEEGHPDNAVPAMVGGLTVCALDGGKVVHRRIDPPKLTVALCIPDVLVETARARAALPDAYSRSDVVFQTSRLSFLLYGLLKGDSDALSFGGSDRVHQPFRAPLIGPVDEALDGARKHGASAAFISGSGSTLAAFVLDSAVDPAGVAKALGEPFSARGVGVKTMVTKPRASGAWTSF